MTPIEGDLSLVELGIKEEDMKLIKDNVSVIINSAASVDFNATLDAAIWDNIDGTLKIYELAKKCKKLVSFLHISTAYVNCNRREQWIEE